MANNHLHRLKLKHLSFLAILCKKFKIAKIYSWPDTDPNLPKNSWRPPFSSPGCWSKNVAKYFRDTPAGGCQRPVSGPGGGVTCETEPGRRAPPGGWWRCPWAWPPSPGPVTPQTRSCQHWPQQPGPATTLQSVSCFAKQSEQSDLRLAQCSTLRIRGWQGGEGKGLVRGINLFKKLLWD